MGLRLSWRKGFHAVTDDHHQRHLTVEHTWIGITYSIVHDGVYRRCLEIFRKLAHPRGTAAQAVARSAAGKASRIAYVIPAASPFAAVVWAALAGSSRAADSSRSEAPRGYVSTVPVHVAAGWLIALLAQAPDTEPSDTLFPLERKVFANLPPEAFSAASAVVFFDASPWCGGAAHLDQGSLTEWFSVTWDQCICRILSAEAGNSKHQSKWEFVTLFIAMFVWPSPREQLRLYCGDNIGALTDALNLVGRGAMLKVAREIVWRKVRHDWCPPSATQSQTHCPVLWLRATRQRHHLLAWAGLTEFNHLRGQSSSARIFFHGTRLKVKEYRPLFCMKLQGARTTE